jgi:hypothetical protein
VCGPGDAYTGTQPETADTAKVEPKFVRCRATTEGQGVHREVESEGHAEKDRAVIEGATPRMNRSAKDGASSSWHYGSEGVLTHPSQQGVCGRHGTEDLGVTEGKARSVCGWRRDKRPYQSEDEVGSEARRVVGQPNSTTSRVKAR